MKLPFFLVLILFSLTCFLSPAPLQADDDLLVEGIIYESNSPEDAMAVVNGVPLKKGDVIQDYTLTEINPTSALFTHKSGQIKTVSLLAGKPSKASAPAPKATETVQKKEKETEEKKPALPFPNFQLPDIMAKMASISIIMDLKNIQTQAMIHYSQQGDIPTIKSLVDSGELNPVFGTGTKGNYNFEIKSGAKGDPVVFADPIDGHPELSHYMIDEWSNIRVEKNKRATAKSTVYQN